MSETVERAKKDLTTLMNDLKTLADETRVKAHLAGMEAKSTWNELQGRVDELEQRVQSGKVDAVGEVKAAVDDLKTHLRALRDMVASDKS